MLKLLKPLGLNSPQPIRSPLSDFSLAQAFAPSISFVRPTVVCSTTELEACRVNAKKEKRQRNRENMRKFSKKGKTSRKKMMRKAQSTIARQLENEFLAKCFLTIPPPEVKEERNNRY